MGTDLVERPDTDAGLDWKSPRTFVKSSTGRTARVTAIEGWLLKAAGRRLRQKLHLFADGGLYQREAAAWYAAVVGLSA
jgi:hypothetical protein